MAQWRNPTYQDSKTPIAFDGGLNTGSSSFDVADNNIISGYGWGTDGFPALSTDVGRTAYGASGGAQTRLLENYSNIHLVRAVGGKLQYYNGSAWTDIATLTDADWSAANFGSLSKGSLLLMTNGTDAVQQWNGSSLSAISAAPKGKYLTVHKGFVFIAKGTTIYWSSYDNPSDWSSPEDSGQKDYYTSNGGDISGIYSFNNQVIVFKPDTYAEIFGTDYYTFQFVENSHNIGCVNAKTISEVRGNLIWLGQTDVYQYQGGRPQAIGQPIRSYLNNINQAYLSKCCGFTDGIKYYLCLVTGTNTEPDTKLVYDTRYGKWEPAAPNEQYRYGARLNGVTFAGDAGGQTYQVGTGTTNNGAALTWSLETKDFHEGSPELHKEYYSLQAHILAPSGSTFNFQYSVDQGSTYTTIGNPITVSANAQVVQIQIPLDGLPPTNWIRFKLYGTGPVTIYRLIRMFRVFPLEVY